MIFIPESLADYCELLQWAAGAIARAGDVECWVSHVDHLLRNLRLHAHGEEWTNEELCALDNLSAAVTQLGNRHGAGWTTGGRAQWHRTSAMIDSARERASR